MKFYTLTFFLLTILAVSSAAAKSPMIVAHRGASYDAPENTLAAFHLAWEMGADGIEGDFYLTQDRQIVCIHDADTRRVSGKDMTVESSTLAELRTLDCGSWKDTKFATERIPVFADVIATVPPGKTFVIELKSKVKIVPFLAEELKKAGRSDIQLLIISFDEATVRECKQQLPHVRAHWLTSFKQDSSTTATYRPHAVDIAKTVRRCSADGVGMQANTEVIDAMFMHQLIAGGCHEFHVWTIDDVEVAEHFRDLGAIGITTNRPDLIGQKISTKNDND